MERTREGARTPGVHMTWRAYAGHGVGMDQTPGRRVECAKRRRVVAKTPDTRGQAQTDARQGVGVSAGFGVDRMWARRGSHRETQAGRRERGDAGETDAGPGNRDTG